MNVLSSKIFGVSKSKLFFVGILAVGLWELVLVKLFNRLPTKVYIEDIVIVAMLQLQINTTQKTSTYTVIVGILTLIFSSSLANSLASSTPSFSDRSSAAILLALSVSPCSLAAVDPWTDAPLSCSCSSFISVIFWKSRRISEENYLQTKLSQ